MDKLTFENLYKFLVSLGVVLMAAPVVAVSFLLSRDVQLISQTEYEQLHSYSVHLIELKDKIIMNIQSFYIWPCIIFEAVGIFCIGIGLWNWIKIQTEQNNQEKAKTELLKLKIEQQTPKDIHNREQEILSEIDESDENSTSEENSNKTNHIEKTEDGNVTITFSKDDNKQQNSIEKYWMYQEAFFSNEVYRYVLHDKYTVKMNVKLEDKFIDGIAISKDDSNKDVIFEYKWSHKRVDSKTLIKTADSLKSTMDRYYRVLNRKCEGKIVIVTSEEVVKNTYLWEQSTYPDKFRDISIILVSEESLNI